MRLEWLEDILAVVDSGSFSEAADRRNLTQSAFSRRIKTIEDQLGVQLFNRSKKPVQLSQATLIHRDRIREIVRELRQLGQDLQDSQVMAENRVVLACQHAISTSLAPGIVRSLLEHDTLAIRIRSANLDECYGMLINGGAHITIAYHSEGEAPAPMGPFETLDLGADALIPVAHADLDISGSSVPTIAYPREVFLGRFVARNVLPRLPANRRIERRVETALTTAALEFAKDGVGVAWVPQSLVADALADGTLRQARDLSAAVLRIAAVRIAGEAPPAAQRVWDRLRETQYPSEPADAPRRAK